MRRLRFFTATAFVLAVLLGGIFWLRHHQAAARRLEQWKAQREEDAIPPVVGQAFEWERANLSLAQFADLVAAKSGLSVELDEAGIAADGSRKPKPREINVSVPRGSFPVDVLLRMVLASNRLCADLHGQTLVITTLEKSTERNRLRTIVYPLPQPERSDMDEEDWSQVIGANIHGHVEALPGAIVVVATATEHRRARLVIDTICGLRDDTPGPVVIPPAPIGAAEKRILAALDEPMSLDVVEMPLRDVVLYLVDRHGVPLILLADKLEEASVGLDTPITKNLNGISLRSVLQLVLKDLELTYVLRDEALVITTPEDAEARLRTVAYPVHDLVTVAKGLADFDPLIELLSASLTPDSWGDGNNNGIRVVGDGWLIVEHTDNVHEQIASLFATLRRILSSEDHAEVQPVNPRTEAEQTIRVALDRRIHLDFEDIPLKEVVSDLHELLNIPIALSLRKLEEASVSPDTPVTQHLPEGRARDQLELILRELELDFVIRDEVLQITTPEDVESQLVTRVYDTRQLIGKRISADELRELIQSTIQPKSWDNSGGPGHAEVYRDLLVLSHTDRIHKETEMLLASLAEPTSESNQPPASELKQ
jgi:hypothetical protein